MFNAYNQDRFIAKLHLLNEERSSILMKDLKNCNAADAGKFYVLRCDVERQLRHTLHFAEKLKEAGVCSTFYFHTRQNCYDAGIFQEFIQLGHEVGYHHECLDRARGDFDQAKALFLSESEFFKQDSIKLETVCAHGEPGLKKVGYRFNYELLEKYPDLIANKGVEEVYIDIKQKWDPFYISDVFSSIKNFWNLLDQLNNHSDKLTQILIHPHRWHNNALTVSSEVLIDIKQHLSNKVVGHRAYDVVKRS